MNTRAPSLSTLVVLIAFVGSCIGLTVYLWLAFGGPIPLKPESYRIEIPFRDASGLVPGADVRIAGVDVGKVVSTELDAETQTTNVEINIEQQYAPRPADTRAILRGKSLLAEVYLELTPGSASAPTVPEHGSLAPGHVAKRVQVGDVLNTFDAPTRDALRVWLTDAGRGYDGSAAELNRFIAALEPLETSAGDALVVLAQEDRAVSGLIRDSADMFAAFTQNQGQLQALIENSARAFSAVAARDRDLADIFRILPTFLTETRLTAEEVAAFATSATPLVNQLIPAARALVPVVDDVEAFAPELHRLLVGIRPLSAAARDGIPALGRLLEETEPLLERAKPYLGGLIPTVDYFTTYRREVAGLIGNLAAATQATLPAVGGGKSLHYLRAALPISLESLAPLPGRFGTTQSNPYPKPGTATDLASGYAAFGAWLCESKTLPAVGADLSAELATATESYYTDVPPLTSDQPLAPNCHDDGPLGPAVDAGDGYFPQLKPLP